MISIKSPGEIAIMAEGGKILARIMRELIKKVRPGITTKELDRLAESLILSSFAKASADKKSSADAKALADRKAKCSFKGYEGFPSCLCTSINEEIVHSVPSGRALKEGDIITLDLGILWKGFHNDMAVTLPVGKIDSEKARLIRVTKKALKRGIKKVRPGNTVGDIGNTIQRYVESQRYNVVRDLCGHGIGRELHEDPKILNYGKRHKGEELKEGMVICIEPMITVGDYKLKSAKDGFGYETKDGLLSCHFEQTIAVTRDGSQVLTPIT